MQDPPAGAVGPRLAFDKTIQCGATPEDHRGDSWTMQSSASGRRISSSAALSMMCWIGRPASASVSSGADDGRPAGRGHRRPEGGQPLPGAPAGACSSSACRSTGSARGAVAIRGDCSAGALGTQRCAPKISRPASRGPAASGRFGPPLSRADCEAIWLADWRRARAGLRGHRRAAHGTRPPCRRARRRCARRR